MRTLHRHGIRLLALGLLLGLLAVALPADVTAQGAKTSESVVKITGKADRPEGSGKQTLTLTVSINSPWHLYANPVGSEDLSSAQTTVTVNARERPTEVKVDYPAGKTIKDKTFGEYKVYEGTVTIKAHVQRAKGDTSPLQVSVKLQACNDKSCLLPSTVKLSVP
jgi:DsbC/DsbD-like thiol-disulfide interchange protein